MNDRFNTIAGWTLFAGIVGLGLSSVSAKYYQADKHHRPHHMGYEIEGVEAEGGAAEGPSLAVLLSEADMAKGEKIFGKCTSCHTITPGGANGIGPNLHGVVGEEIGKGVAGYAFSSALSGHGGNWSFDSLDEWLKSPKAFAPGTKMSFAGLGKAEDRAALILYLNSQGSNLPLPTPEAAPAAPDAAAAGAEGDAAPAADAAAGADAPAAEAPATPAAAE